MIAKIISSLGDTWRESIAKVIDFSASNLNIIVTDPIQQRVPEVDPTQIDSSSTRNQRMQE